MQRPFRYDYTDIRPASFAKRLLAMLYDSLILVAIWLFVAIVATALNQGGVTSPLGRAALQSAQFCLSFLFFGYFWTRNGQTLGMQAWRLRVQTLDGQRITWMQALIRFMGAIISWLPCGLGYLWLLFSDERLTWHDRWSHSCVVHLPQEALKKGERKGARR